jgi:hypothetical protein
MATDTSPTAPKPKRRWFQYSLRTLLVVVTLFAIPCSWLVVMLRQAERQRKAVAAIRNLGGSTGLGSYSSPPEWLRSLVGDDFFQTVNSVDLNLTKVTDSDLENLDGLGQLKHVSLFGADKITDAGLGHLERMSQLLKLNLAFTKVGDAGLEHIKGLNQLEDLSLTGTNITDDGLKHLKGLNHLDRLLLSHTKITDAGLEHLKGLSQLKLLWLYDTQVTDEGARKLQQALPNCRIGR